MNLKSSKNYVQPRHDVQLLRLETLKIEHREDRDVVLLEKCQKRLSCEGEK